MDKWLTAKQYARKYNITLEYIRRNTQKLLKLGNMRRATPADGYSLYVKYLIKDEAGAHNLSERGIKRSKEVFKEHTK